MNKIEDSHQTDVARPEGLVGRRQAKSEIELIISDNGIGLPEDVDLKNKKTLGLELVDTLTAQIEGTIELDRTNGTEFKIVFKA